LREALIANCPPCYTDAGIDFTLDPRAGSFTVEDGIASAIVTERRNKVDDANANNRGLNKKPPPQPFSGGLLFPDY